MASDYELQAARDAESSARSAAAGATIAAALIQLSLDKLKETIATSVTEAIAKNSFFQHGVCRAADFIDRQTPFGIAKLSSTTISPSTHNHFFSLWNTPATSEETALVTPIARSITQGFFNDGGAIHSFVSEDDFVHIAKSIQSINKDPSIKTSYEVENVVGYVLSLSPQDYYDIGYRGLGALSIELYTDQDLFKKTGISKNVRKIWDDTRPDITGRLQRLGIDATHQYIKLVAEYFRPLFTPEAIRARGDNLVL
jgi:hypothetical protein